jgi:hypothetical protein
LVCDGHIIGEKMAKIETYTLKTTAYASDIVIIADSQSTDADGDYRTKGQKINVINGLSGGTTDDIVTIDANDLPQDSGKAFETTITDDDTKVPTSGAVVDYVNPQNAQIPFTISLGGNAYTGTGIKKIQIPFAMNLTSVVLGSGTAPTGDVLTYDINYHASDPDSAVTIFSSNPSIAATSHTGNSTSFSISSLAKNGWIVIDCDNVGSTLPGAEITISLRQD